MPELPSGRKVLIEPGRLTRLLDHGNVPSKIVQIMKINSIQALMDWCEVAFYVTAEEEHDDDIFIVISEGSLPPPLGHFLKRTGCPVSHWESIAQEWSEKDRLAMNDWLTGSGFQEYLESQLALVRESQQSFVHSDNLMTRMIATWPSLCPDHEE